MSALETIAVACGIIIGLLATGSILSFALTAAIEGEQS